VVFCYNNRFIDKICIKSRVVAIKTEDMIDINTLIDTSDNTIEEAKIKTRVAEILNETKKKQNNAVLNERYLEASTLGIKIFALQDRLKNA
jgi:hypothetical protein